MKMCFSIVKIILNVYHLGYQTCAFCNLYEMNITQHILFICPSVENIQCKERRKLALTLLPNLYEDIFNMNVDHRCNFLLHMLNGPYVPELHISYRAVCVFINNVYYDYLKKMNMYKPNSYYIWWSVTYPDTTADDCYVK